jgi:hypothetical protein
MLMFLTNGWEGYSGVLISVESMSNKDYFFSIYRFPRIAHSGDTATRVEHSVLCCNADFIRLRMLRRHLWISEIPYETNCLHSWNSSLWTENHIDICVRWRFGKDWYPKPSWKIFGSPIGSSYDHLTYIDCHSWYSVDARPASCDVDKDGFEPVRFASPRKNSAVCILHSVHPRTEKLFALELLLRQFPARRWEDLRYHNGEVHQTFHEAARQLGLVSNRDQEAEICPQDAIGLNRLASDIRFLLAQMVYYGASRALWKPISVIIWQMMEILRTLFVAKLISCFILLIWNLTTMSLMTNYLYLSVPICICPCWHLNSIRLHPK